MGVVDFRMSVVTRAPKPHVTCIPESIYRAAIVV